jgi:Domain of unknown function (DUF4337)
MSVIDTVLKMVTRQSKETLTGSRSEREAKIKDKAGLVINIFALLLAINTFIAGGLSSTVMNNTIKANDLWNFYQAKSIKQTEYQLASEQTTDTVKAAKWSEKAASYESDPVTGEGKKEILEKAKKLEAERDYAKKRSPWISYASTAYQLSIVLLSASILAVNMYLFWGSFVVAAAGLVLMSQGILMWF